MYHRVKNITVSIIHTINSAISRHSQQCIAFSKNCTVHTTYKATKLDYYKNSFCKLPCDWAENILDLVVVLKASLVPRGHKSGARPVGCLGTGPERKIAFPMRAGNV